MNKVRASTHPYWREGFQTTGIETLRSVGFTHLPTQVDDGRHTVVRRQGHLCLYIELDPARCGNAALTCQWLEVDTYKQHPVVDMTLLLWEGIVYNGWSNKALLYRAEELTDTNKNQMEYNQRRSLKSSTFVLPSGTRCDVYE